MSVHFFYDFKDELITKLKERYADELKQYKIQKAKEAQLDEAEDIIMTYFSGIKEQLQDVIEASDGDVFIEVDEEGGLVEFTVHDRTVKFRRLENGIEVKYKYYVPEEDILETRILGYIVPGDKKCKTKKLGKIHEGGHFDENTLNHYLRKYYADLLEIGKI